MLHNLHATDVQHNMSGSNYTVLGKQKYLQLLGMHFPFFALINNTLYKVYYQLEYLKKLKLKEYI
jgi:hypothetical protein